MRDQEGYGDMIGVYRALSGVGAYQNEVAFLELRHRGGHMDRKDNEPFKYGAITT